MRCSLALVAVLVACAKPRPAPVLGNTPTPTAQIVPTPEPEGCAVIASANLRVAGEPAIVDVVSCNFGDKPADEADPESELTITSRAGYVKITRAGGRTLRTLITEWTDGWEWGGEVSLEGPLVATAATNDAVLVGYLQHSSDTSGYQIIAFAVKNEELARVGAWSEDVLSVTLSTANDVARVESCVLGDPSLPHAGCDGRQDADPGPGFELRWTGTAIDEKPLSPGRPKPPPP